MYTVRLASLLLLAAIARPAITRGSTRDDPAVGEGDATGIDQMRSILRLIAINDYRVPQFDVSPPESAPRQRARRSGLATPVDQDALFVLHINIKVRVR